jgi:hypothetical protein
MRWPISAIAGPETSFNHANKGEVSMRKSLAAIALSSALIAGGAGISALYAEDAPGQSGPTTGRGMMGRGGMMGSSGMAEHCGSMMQSRDGGRPNDQWRRRAPAPDDNG